MSVKRHHPPATIRAIVSLRADGLTYAEVARRVGLPRQRCIAIAREHGALRPADRGQHREVPLPRLRFMEISHE